MMWVSEIATVIAVCFLVSDSTAAMGGLFKYVYGGVGGCTQLRLCCPGKDHTCSAYESIVQGANPTKCFCDSECLSTGDCCYDYQGYCQPVDCLVDNSWQKWGKCSVGCGRGVRKRTKRIIHFPRNGGKECGTTEQHGVCEGTNCKPLRATITTQKKMKDVAYILPMSIARWRIDSSYGPRREIRRNLFRQQLHRSFNGYRDKYCATYRLTEVSQTCYTSFAKSLAIANWTSQLVLGKVVCVECQSTAVGPSLDGRCKGDGIFEKETRWVATAVSGCSGKWTMTKKPTECQCTETGQENRPKEDNFIFV